MKSSFNSCPQHESFEELAALATVGELSPLELQRLRHHVAECPTCRETYEAFADVTSNDLGVTAAHRVEDVDPGDASEREASEQLARLRNRLKTDATAKQPPVELRMSGGRKNYRRVVYAVAAAILLTIAAVGGIALWRTTKDVSAERARSRGLQSVVDSLKQEKKNETGGSDTAAMPPLQQNQQARASLAKSFTASEAKHEEMRTQSVGLLRARRLRGQGACRVCAGRSGEPAGSQTGALPSMGMPRGESREAGQSRPLHGGRQSAASVGSDGEPPRCALPHCRCV